MTKVHFLGLGGAGKAGQDRTLVMSRDAANLVGDAEVPHFRSSRR